MENKNYEMQSWRIDMTKSKRGEVKHVSVYTRTTTTLVIMFTIGVIAAGIYMIVNDPNVLRISLLGVGLAICLPYTWACVNSKKKLKSTLEAGYKPLTDIDSDRLVIAMKYFGMSDLIKTKYLINDGDLMSDFDEKRKLRQRQSIFSGLKRRVMKKSIEKRNTKK